MRSPKNYFKSMYYCSLAVIVLGAAVGSGSMLSLQFGSAGQFATPFYQHVLPCCAIGSLVALIIGIGFALFSNQKRIEIDELLSGESLIAYVDYELDEMGEENPGYAFIGPGGVFKNGFYFDWSDNSRNLLNVTLKHGPNPVLCFLYVVASARATGRGGMMQNCCMVPIPPGQEALARKVLANFK